MDEEADLQDVWLEEKRAEIAYRQDRAYRLLLIYQQQDGGDDDQLTAIKDLISNLLHLGDQYGMIDARQFVISALDNYEAERDEAGLD